VANDIEVKLPTSATRTDPDIAEAAVRALKWDALLALQDLKVTVSNGWVTLRGTVEWQFQRREAERAVRALSGVVGVTNLIEVKPTAKPSPDDLKRSVAEALVRSAQTDAQRITVEVQGDKVILTGTVRSWAERQDAERAAWSASGVKEVDNRITISL
jgi:osmotically-inducible protein OsmY